MRQERRSRRPVLRAPAAEGLSSCATAPGEADRVARRPQWPLAPFYPPGKVEPSFIPPAPMSRFKHSKGKVRRNDEIEKVIYSLD